MSHSTYLFTFNFFDKGMKTILNPATDYISHHRIIGSIKEAKRKNWKNVLILGENIVI